MQILQAVLIIALFSCNGFCQGLAERIEKLLNSPKQLEVLPPIVSNIHISPDHKPCFIGKFEEPLETPQFQLICGKNIHSILGWAKEGVILKKQILKNTQKFLKNVPELKSKHSRKATVYNIYRAGGLIYRTDRGFYTEESDDPILDPLVFNNNCKVMDLNGKLVLISPKNTICVGSLNQWEIMEYNNSNGHIRGLLQDPDGRFLVLGNKLAWLNRIPREKEFLEFLDAVESGGGAKRQKLLEKLTSHNREALNGFVGLLQESKDHWGQYHKIGPALSNTCKMMERLFQDLPVASDRKNEILKKFQQAAGAVMEELKEEAGPDVDFSPSRLAELIRSGYQYMDGQWVRLREVLFQDSLHQALVRMDYHVGSHQDYRTGLYLLTGKGQLKPLFQGHRNDLRHKGNVIRDNKGRLLFLLPKFGLARWDGQQFEWVADNHTIRSMDNMEGCDFKGRIYFSKYGGGRGPDTISALRMNRVFYAFQEGGQEENWRSSEKIPFPIQYSSSRGEPVVLDDKGELWFVSGAMTEPHIRNLWEGCEANEKAPQNKKSSHSRFLYHLDLKNRVCTIFPNVGSGECTLHAGKGGAVLASFKKNAVLVHQDKVYTAKDLHELAVNHFPVLLECSKNRHPKWLRIQDLLWVYDNNRVEVYRDGVSLDINRRLVLKTGMIQHAQLVGPFRTPDHEPMLGLAVQSQDAYRSQSGNLVLAIHKPDQILLTQTQFKPYQISFHPLVADVSANRLFYSDQHGNLVELKDFEEEIHHKGLWKPHVFCPKTGALLCGSQPKVLLTPDGPSTLSLTQRRHLCPVQFENNGSLLCITPHGKAWLTPDGQELINWENVSLDALPSRYIGSRQGKVFVINYKGRIEIF